MLKQKTYDKILLLESSENMNNFKENEIEEIKKLLLKYEFASETLKTDLNILIKGYIFKTKNNPVEHIKTRIKTIDSACKKLEKKNYDITVDNLKNHVHDMVGIRIVCSFLTDVYEIVNLIKSSNQFKIIDEKDYITNPKKSGYISYHLIVQVPVFIDNKNEYVEAEIQIRTIAMDFWASLDHKIQYKFPKEIPEEVKNEMYNCSVDIKNLDKKMGDIRRWLNDYRDK